jgi:hypothetical protein
LTGTRCARESKSEMRREKRDREERRKRVSERAADP